MMSNLEQTVLQKQNQIIALQNEIGYGTACNPSTSGEAHALRYAFKDYIEKVKFYKDTTYAPKVIFDVGAYHGEFLEVAYPILLECHFHCFEPDPEAYTVLQKNIIFNEGILSDRNITLNNFAISDMDGQQILYNDRNDSGLSSLVCRELSSFDIDFSQEQIVQTQRLFSYCTEHRIPCIDYLKLDIEGYEFSVLSDVLSSLIENHLTIKNIQFEFGGCNIDSRTFMKDFYTILGPYYNIFRIHPEGLIPMNEYKECYEVFQPVNYYCEIKV